MHDRYAWISASGARDTAIIVTDTGTYTDAIFGIFYLLGLQFSPRTKKIRMIMPPSTTTLR